MMNSWIRGIAFVALLACASIVSYWAAERWEESRSGGDELSWLADDLGLSGPALETARRLLQEHQQSVRGLVTRIRDAEEQVHQLTQSDPPTRKEDLSQAVHRLDSLRAEMQFSVLRHAQAVRPLLEVESQERYLQEIEKRVLGISIRQ